MYFHVFMQNSQFGLVLQSRDKRARLNPPPPIHKSLISAEEKNFLAVLRAIYDHVILRGYHTDFKKAGINPNLRLIWLI